MGNKEEIKKRQQEERAALNIQHAEKLAELERRGRLEATLPEELPAPDFVHFHGKRGGAPWVVYKVKDLAAALDVLNVYAPGLVPYRDARAEGCRVLQPLQEMSAAYKSAAKEARDWTGPMLRYDAGEGYQSARIEFWTRTKRGQLLKIGIEQERGAFGFWASCSMDNYGNVKPGSWRAPHEPQADEVTTWASGSPKSASWSLRWHTLISFRAVMGEIVNKRAEQAKESRARSLAEYKARRKPEELAQKCRLVLDTLNRAEVVKALPRGAPASGWTLDEVRATGYEAINKAAQAFAPDVVKIGLHDFVNTVYFLSKDTDGDEHAQDYRDDLRAVFSAVCAGQEVK